MKRILLPCDFSEPALEAYKFALELATASQGEVVVIKAIDLPVLYEASIGGQPYVFDPSIVKELEEDAKKNFSEMKSKYPQAVPVSFSVGQGPVAYMIRHMIEEKKADLVVMGTHGASGLKEFIVGSNTEKIVRTSKVPVIAVRKAPSVSSIRNLVFPILLDLNQQDLIKHVKEIQTFFKAKLNILYVNTPGRFKTDLELKRVMEEYVKHYGLENYSLSIRNDGYESDAILHFAAEVNADMIVMATHGRRGLGHLLMGSIAEDVVNHLQCPIWTYTLS